MPCCIWRPMAGGIVEGITISGSPVQKQLRLGSGRLPWHRCAAAGGEPMDASARVRRVRMLVIGAHGI